MSSYQSIFPAAKRSAWDRLVGGVLKGAAPDSLVRRDEDGLDIKALYEISEITVGSAGIIAPGPNAANRAEHGWDITQTIMATHNGNRAGIAISNRQILEAIRSGANSLTLFIDDASADYFDQLLAGVVVNALDIQLCPLGNSRQSGGDIAAKFDQFAAALNADDTASLRLNANAGFDPLCGEEAIRAGLVLLNSDHCYRRIFNLDGWIWHNRGLTSAAEIGVILAGLAAIFRRANDENLDMNLVAQSICVTAALPADSFAGLAKLRALRLGWTGLCAALGLDETPLYIAAIASLRMVSKLDPDVNMLRNTTALLGGAMGGADRMGAFPHDAINGESEGASRLTRMTQVMMIEEAGLGCAVDPAAGAPFIEQRSDDLAIAGWAVMQEIEAKGGLGAALADGMISGLASAAAHQRNAELSAGRTSLVGVTLQPNGDEQIDAAAQFGDFLHSDLYGGLRRPAAIIETVRQSSRALRILIILPADGDDDEGKAAKQAKREGRLLRDWLAIAGLQAVTLYQPSDDEIVAAAADIVIFGTGFYARDTAQDTKAALFGAARQMAAEKILNCDDQLGLLGDLLVHGSDADIISGGQNDLS